jgi:hypothetical protein
MDIDAPQKSIVMSLSLFTDDLETVLHNKYGIDGWIGTDKEHQQSRKLIREYIDERLVIKVNHTEKLTLLTDSMAIIENALWFYMKAVSSQEIHHIEMDNRVLTDFFSTQTNLVIINTGSKEKGYQLDKRKHIIELSL